MICSVRYVCISHCASRKYLNCLSVDITPVLHLQTVLLTMTACLKYDIYTFIAQTPLQVEMITSSVDQTMVRMRTRL